ncbi:unnamed protein product [Linum trigynum]|uniref:DUF295 domain-containing protein n=1 Tax=Linum trigynum TaxID=586398 RepID=A0AAV2GB44_9ROSI
MDYSGLPNEIIEKIASQHLDTAVSQLLSFSGVCRSWRSAAFLLRCPPVLFVPQTAASAASLSPAAAPRGQIHDFVSLTTLTSIVPTTPLQPPPPPSIALPLFPSPTKMSDVHGQRDRYLRLHQEFITTFPREGASSSSSCSSYYVEAISLASKDGWILRQPPFYGKYRGHLDLYLLNPFTGASIPLPPLKPKYACVRKAIISSSPDDDDCHVFTLSTRQKDLLAWCKVGRSGGGGGWAFPPENCLAKRLRGNIPLDVSYSNGNLYLAVEEALWVVHDILKPSSAAIGPIVKAFPFSRYMKSFEARNCCRPYLCHLDGGRGQVRVVLPDCNGDYYGDHLGFRVFRLVVDEGKGLDRVVDFDCGEGDDYWEQVWSLDGHALFIGAHQSLSFPTTKVDATIADQETSQDFVQEPRPTRFQAGSVPVASSSTTAASMLNPNARGIRGDHIYFALNRVCEHWESFGAANRDGAFDLANRKFQRFAHDERYGDNKTWDPIFWFIPVPWVNTKSTASKNEQRRKKKGKKKKKQITGAAEASQETQTST